MNRYLGPTSGINAVGSKDRLLVGEELQYKLYKSNWFNKPAIFVSPKPDPILEYVSSVVHAKYYEETGERMDS